VIPCRTYLGVGRDFYFARLLECEEPLDRCHQLHSIDGRVRIVAEKFLLRRAESQDVRRSRSLISANLTEAAARAAIAGASPARPLQIWCFRGSPLGYDSAQGDGCVRFLFSSSERFLLFFLYVRFFGVGVDEDFHNG
jgi:hypothetical protein